MSKTQMTWFVAKLDPEGIPRAWGRAFTLEAARVEANRQLSIYRMKKREVGDDYLANAEYTTEEMEERFDVRRAE